MTRVDVRAWTGVELIEPLTGGARNPAFLARHGDERLVVRRSGRTAESLAWELELLDHLWERGFQVPLTVHTDDGRRHDDGVLVQHFIEGHPPGTADEWRAVVDTLVQLHEATVGWPQRPGFGSIRTLAYETRGGDVDLSAMPEPAVRAIRDSWRAIADGPECAIHGDVGAGNLLVNDDGIALLDWDEARVDVPWLDFADVPDEVELPVPYDRETLVTAGLAWETATCWVVEPEYAARRLEELFARRR